MNVHELKQSMETLPPEDLDELSQWIAERKAQLWDEQIEADAKAGRLDAFFARTLASYRAGKTRPLEEVLGEDDATTDAAQP